jgi:hypothetical protein
MMQNNTRNSIKIRAGMVWAFKVSGTGYTAKNETSLNATREQLYKETAERMYSALNE